uniref:Uncharacterized protein n=1 Tax=Arundo donax TaxID=35708 RepID=A0A0A8YY71_ARUDO
MYWNNYSYQGKPSLYNKLSKDNCHYASIHTIYCHGQHMCL